MISLNDSTINVHGLEMPYFSTVPIDHFIDETELQTIVVYISSLEFTRIQSTAVERLMKGEEIETQPLYPDGPTYKLKYYDRGLFSLIFIVETRGEKIVLKVPNTYKHRGDVPPVSYIREISMISELKSELGEELSRFNIYLPNIYLASSNFLFREYIDGYPLEEARAPMILEEIERLLSEWIQKKRREYPYKWDNVQLDLRDKLGKPAGKNFIVSNDGKIYLIDPFIG